MMEQQPNSSDSTMADAEKIPEASKEVRMTSNLLGFSFK